MSIFGAMYTSVSGMNAQAARLATYSENIANSDTVGYKTAEAQFETMLVNQSASTYSSGGVDTHIRYGIGQQGVLSATNSPTDLAIRGGGFFVVADENGNPHLTRSGSFAPDAAGYLVNTAGFRLMGVDAGGAGGTASSSVGYAGLSLIKLNLTGLVASPTGSGVFAANLPSTATAAAGAAALPSANGAGAAPTEKSSLVAYDNLGNKVTLDLYLTKTATNAWEAAVFDSSQAAASGGFPYASGPIAVSSLQFDPTNGRLAAGSGSAMSIPIPNGRTLALDISAMSQLGSAYSITQATIDGNAPSQFSQLKVDANGLISAVYQNGISTPAYQIQLATVPSVNNLEPLSGNIYDTTQASGNVLVGTPGVGALGNIISSSLENSTVDMATELTGMIETQRSYTANSKAFQVAADVTDVLMNLKV